LISDAAGDWTVLKEAVAQQCCHLTLLKQCDDQKVMNSCYIAGFVDGDDSIFVSNCTGGFQLMLYQTQVLRKLLYFLLQ